MFIKKEGRSVCAEVFRGRFMGKVASEART